MKLIKNPRSSAFIRVLNVSLAVLIMSACAGEVGQTQTATINVPKPEDRSATWDVELNLGAADVKIGSSSEGLVSGTITYNVESLKPTVTSGERRLQIGQDAGGVLPLNTHNEWRLQLGQGVPMNLSVNTGASSGDWELGGLSLRRLAWLQGAADAVVKFSQPNPDRLDSFTVNGGAASLTLRGLANANIRTANITAGAGAVTLVFDGQLSADTEVILDGGVSAITIYSGGNPVQLISEGALKNVDSKDWTQTNDTYSSPEWTGNSPMITVRARLGVAALQLITGQ